MSVVKGSGEDWPVAMGDGDSVDAAVQSDGV